MEMQDTHESYREFMRAACIIAYNQKARGICFSVRYALAMSEGAEPEAESSVEAIGPPGEVEAGAEAGVGELAGAGAGCGGGLATNLRLRYFKRGQLVGTCQGVSARWQVGQMPIPAIARSHQVLTTLMEKEESHSKGFVHSLPDLSTTTAEAPGPPFLGVFLL
jgi:hypothetical protein